MIRIKSSNLPSNGDESMLWETLLDLLLENNTNGVHMGGKFISKGIQRLKKGRDKVSQLLLIPRDIFSYVRIHIIRFILLTHLGDQGAKLIDDRLETEFLGEDIHEDVSSSII